MDTLAIVPKFRKDTPLAPERGAFLFRLFTRKAGIEADAQSFYEARRLLHHYLIYSLELWRYARDVTQDGEVVYRFNTQEDYIQYLNDTPKEEGGWHRADFFKKVGCLDKLLEKGMGVNKACNFIARQPGAALALALSEGNTFTLAGGNQVSIPQLAEELVDGTQSAALETVRAAKKEPYQYIKSAVWYPKTKVLEVELVFITYDDSNFKDEDVRVIILEGFRKKENADVVLGHISRLEVADD